MFTAEPAFDADDAPLPDGEAVAAPQTVGARVTLRFVSPYEPWLSLDGHRIAADHGGAGRTLLVWFGRRQSALLRALDLGRGLRASLGPDGLVVTDIVELADGVAVDHGSLMAALEGARVRLPPFAALGTSLGRSELLARARSLYAAGTPLDVRIEEQQRVVGRRSLRVGRT
jgi:hypothetical protein